MPTWMLVFHLAAADTIPMPSTAQDRWLGADKLKHVAVAAAVQGASYAALRLGTDHRQAIVGATVTTAALSLFKEQLDRTGTGFSVRDLAWDAAGILLTTLLLTRTPHP